MWEISVNSQVLTVLYSVVFGVAISFFFDFMTAAVKGFSNSKVALFASDLFFWILTALSVFMFLMARTNGEIRGYVIFSCAIGFLLYRATLGKILYPSFIYFFSFLKRFYLKISNALARFCDFLGRIIDFSAQKSRKTAVNTLNIVKKLLKSAKGMLYTCKNGNNSENDKNE